MVNYRNSVRAALAAGALFVSVAAATPAVAQADEQTLIDHSVGTLHDLRHDKEFGNARDLMNRARAVLIAPRIFKAGF